jgi:SagB-type dehydrogenase family enzyme
MTQVALGFHNETKHSPQRLCGRAAPDPENKPSPYKTYASLPRLPGQLPLPDTSVPALDAMAAQPPDGNVISTRPVAIRLPDGAELLHLCRYANGLLRVAQLNRPAHHPAACTGGLRHIELYLVCRDLDGLPAGVHHYDISSSTFESLRAGDYRAALVAAAANESTVRTAPAVLVCTSILWQNAWKYGERSYRHVFWDAGTVLANLTTLAAGRGLASRVVMGFVDAEVSALLGLESARELVVALVPLGSCDDAGPAATVSPLHVVSAPACCAEAVPPGCHRIHRASSLGSSEEVMQWRNADGGDRCSSERPVPVTATLPPSPSVEAVIRRRCSARAFGSTGLDHESAQALLRIMVAPIDTDFGSGPGAGCLINHVLIRAVDRVRPGTYRVREDGSIRLLRPGAVRAESVAGALGQRQAGDSAINFYLLANLPALLARHGNRGYRVAQLAAGVVAGRLYLAAYALGYAATGLTFHDDQMAGLAAADGLSVVFLLAVGPTGCREAVVGDRS